MIRAAIGPIVRLESVRHSLTDHRRSDMALRDRTSVVGGQSCVLPAVSIYMAESEAYARGVAHGSK